MKKKNAVLIVSAVVFVFCVTGVHAEQILSTWVGDYGIWGNPDNWDPAIVPDNDANTFRVNITANDNEPDIGLLCSRTIDRLDCYGTADIWISSWKGVPVGTPYSVKLTLVDPNGITNFGNLEIANLDVRGEIFNHSELTIDDTEVVGNVINYSTGQLGLNGTDLDGALYNYSGGRIDVEFANDASDHIYNDGIVKIIPASDLLSGRDIYNSGQIEICDGECGAEETFVNNTSAMVKGSGVIYGSESLENNGQVHAHGGSLTLSSEGQLQNNGILATSPAASLAVRVLVDVSNYGTLDIGAGAGMIFDCNMINQTIGTVMLMDGTLAAPRITQKTGATFEGFGKIASDVVIEEDGLIQLTGPTNIVGDVEIGINAVLEISDGITLVTGHTTNNGTIHMKGGRLIPQGGITNNGTVIWEPGLYNNVADFNLDGHVNINDFADFAGTWLWQAQL